MITVALAGATGGVGRTILDHLELSDGFKVVVLSRKPPEATVSAAATKSLQVDYNDVDGLANALSENNVHTVISTIGISSAETSQAQCNLIRAADRSSATKRLMPSEYWAKTVPELLPLDLTVQWWLDAASLLQSSSLEYTRIACGWFMDYWGMPYVKSHLSDFSWGVDLFNRNAAIPGDGGNVISLTLIGDVARAVLLLLEAEDWPEWTFAIADSVTFNDFLRIAERVRGSKFELAYNSREDLEHDKVTILPNPGNTVWNATSAETQERRDLLILFGSFYVSGVLDLSRAPQFSARFPDWRPKRLEEFLEEVWQGKP
ncbi:uncharacterized protein Z520_07222 [Fonsecaea multimorphosa CBS 102226]|uniref:NAD(P)-binding domain-containing protein n=1 Tax=Fonsecaea multimorphosa CBS 102226 TaxID=1442371 RepID=A0A0D2KKE9_9EURO|nr:uncharacterized protein Z520_07222 [Fonsecaea multimorphosa CBS 102226]KIX97108.1 hypothetical protein Z520_07222 [Fonsecaea multimorphosa CBS 102226]OAL22883.1 hypothetical protein AYO22_06791 [Fonsecaea multimorphosa]